MGMGVLHPALAERQHASKCRGLAQWAVSTVVPLLDGELEEDFQTDTHRAWGLALPGGVECIQQLRSMPALCPTHSTPPGRAGSAAAAVANGCCVHNVGSVNVGSVNSGQSGQVGSVPGVRTYT